jgi:hypothetical protein
MDVNGRAVTALLPADKLPIAVGGASSRVFGDSTPR